MKALFSIFLTCLLGVGIAAAQSPEVKTLSGGVLNGKATSLPKPVYPEGVRLAGVGGTVAVDILIDEGGQVISATADPLDQNSIYDADGRKQPPVEADPMLREAAENAARMAKFAPTRLNGAPVKIKGQLLYNFVAKTESDQPHSDNTDAPILNGQATSLPQPAYPPAARAVKATGTVMVRIEIDADGNVTSAKVVSGHPLLRAAARNAALEAKFGPSADAKTPRTGILAYSFEL